MAFQEALRAHLETGLTTVARAWGISRADGEAFGFTDHDRDLTFEGLTFRAQSGLSAGALEQSSGLSIDNTEALGVLSDLSIREEDIDAGRYDGAQVVAWLVNWADVRERSLLFRGSIGEIRRAGGAFRAELRGLSEALNQPMGRVYQKPCTAVLGDAQCRFDTAQGGYFARLDVAELEDNRIFRWAGLGDFEPGWFTSGFTTIETGAAQGLSGTVKRDYVDGEGRRVLELWEPIRAAVQPGDRVHLMAGCDKRFETCRLKFSNALNFQGFPDIPGEDWLTSYPVRAGDNSGGSRR